MPQLIEHIDAIARSKKRDVLFLTFTREGKRDPGRFTLNESRIEILRWLDSMGIGWQPCGEIASEYRFASYDGAVYIDVPFDVLAPEYQKLQTFLEYPDGTIRFPDTSFFVLDLQTAMQNAHHDEPGFWERIADNF
ncbi:hypothetical protein AB3X91_07605 [Paraburkholderia sp. BR14263]|uniref:Uncharacterized protein n=1 Tax=Paraburkholderia guartelaensis TaxID=2546446 RepID=A0ABU9SHD4_9BURK